METEEPKLCVNMDCERYPPDWGFWRRYWRDLPGRTMEEMLFMWRGILMMMD